MIAGWVKQRRFIGGILIGVALLFSLRFVINESSFEDRPVAPREPSAHADTTPAGPYRGDVLDPTGPLVIFGASYAGNWPLDAVKSIPIINAGIAGQRTAQMLERFERDVVAKRPRAVLVWGFINDFFSSDDLRLANERVRATYTEILAKARAAGIEPILATEITSRSPGGLLNSARALVGTLLSKTSYFDQINEQVISVNVWLHDLARAEGLLICDFQRALADASGQRRREFATEDGSHVTAAGYVALTRYATPLLSARLEASTMEDRR